MSSLNYFDSNCMIGTVTVPQPGMFHSVEDLTAEMEFVGIGEALVYHALAKEYHPLAGNEVLMDQIAGREGLHAMWVLLPDTNSDMPAPDELIRRMKRQGVRAARLVPKNYGFILDERTCGPLLSALENEKIPLFIDKDQVDLKDLAQVCEKHPALPVVLTKADWRGNRVMYPMMRDLPNLHLEISQFQAYQGIEDVCEKFGADRFLFGTHLPYAEPGAAITMVTHADISDEEKQKIAGGNLRRLLGLGSPAVVRKAKPCDDIMDALDRGEPLARPLVIDSHCHMGLGKFAILPHDPAEMIGLADKLGIDVLCVSHMASIGPDCRYGNDLIAEGVRQFPDRFVGYGVVNPRYPDDVEPELQRCFGELGMKAIKIHATSHGNYPPDEPGYDPVWRYSERLKVPVLIDVPDGGYEKLDNVCRKFPQARIMLAHSGGNYKMADESIKLAKEHPGVYLEITYTPRPYGMIEYLVEQVGAERVLFGSDWAFRDPRSQIGWAGYARIPLPEKEKILGGNMAGLLQDATEGIAKNL
ncbi:MAG: amidohydrolase family protein [Planctomycetota bacterium]|nr:amidohydrolase family protein [Planctomycetota bacterium]